MLVCVSLSALGKGEYQQTRDGKTQVWNATPKSGETLSWDGGRDRDGYATGFGDLTWYDAAGKVYALYYGNMVHGKLEGAVNFHSGNRRAHAYFVDGGRVTAWARGPAPSKMKVPEDIVAQRRKAEAEPPPPPKSSRTEVAAKPSPPPSRETPKPTAAPEKERPVEQAVSETSATPVESRQPTISEQTPEPVTSTTPTRAFEEPTAVATPTPETTPVASAPMITPEPSATSEIKMEEPWPEQRSTPHEEQSPPPASESPTLSAESSPTRADVSLNALVGPPTSLRPTSEISPAKSQSEPGPRASGALTETEAINLADTEARIHGYPLNNYERPKVDHSKVKGRWTLFYAAKPGAPGSEAPPPFTVTVQDKTKKVEFRQQ
jgi:hypothetical protein